MLKAQLILLSQALCVDCCSMVQYEATRSFPAPSGSDASPLRGYPCIELTGTHFYPWVERSGVLAQEYNTTPARDGTQTAPSTGLTG